VANPEIQEASMAKEVTCPPCGTVIRGEDDVELVANVRHHATEVHHELRASMSDEDFTVHVLGSAREVLI
jgi:predicted small metal-binding protein